MPPKDSFSAEETKLCKDLIEFLKDTQQRCERCVTCGLDMQEEFAAVQQQLRVAESMLRTYGLPGVSDHVSMGIV